jgi:hypothetical protein
MRFKEVNMVFKVSIKLDFAIYDHWIKHFWTIVCVQNLYFSDNSLLFNSHSKGVLVYSENC